MTKSKKGICISCRTLFKPKQPIILWVCSFTFLVNVLFVACLFARFNLTGADAVHSVKEYVSNNNIVWECKDLLSRKFIIPRYELWMCVSFSKKWGLYRSRLFWTILGRNILCFAVCSCCCNFVGLRLMINWRQCSNWCGKLSKCLWNFWCVEVCSKMLLEDLRMWKMVGGVSDELATRIACVDGC